MGKEKPEKCPTCHQDTLYINKKEREWHCLTCRTTVYDTLECNCKSYGARRVKTRHGSEFCEGCGKPYNDVVYADGDHDYIV